VGAGPTAPPGSRCGLSLERRIDAGSYTSCHHRPPEHPANNEAVLSDCREKHAHHVGAAGVKLVIEAIIMDPVLS